MVLENGAVFADRYILVKLLGKGGFSEVWLAQDNKSGLDIALKVYAPNGGLDDRGTEMFSKEFSLVFNSNHTNILTPTYFDVFERSPYLIMPYCGSGGGTSLIGKATADEVLHLIHDVAAGLAYLHSQNPPIIHQDIKPDNILLNDHGDYVITDFGISTKARSTLRKSAMATENSGGTCGYMGPERFSKNPAPVKASDIWSLGAMAYELLEGNTPYGNIGGVMQKNGAEIPDINADVPESLKELIYSCLAQETWDRPSAEDIVKTTESLLAQKADFPGTVLDNGQTVRQEKPEKKVNWKLIIGCGAAAVVAIVLFLLLSKPFTPKVDEEAQAAALARLEFVKDSLRNVILDNPDANGGITDTSTGESIEIFTSGYYTAYGKKLIKDSTSFDTGIEVLKRVIDKKYKSSAEAAAVMAYVYAIRNAGSQTDHIYLGLFNQAVLEMVEPDPSLSEQYSTLALELDPGCYQAMFEKCMDFIGGPQRGFEQRRLADLRDMFEAGKQASFDANDLVYNQLFANFEDKFRDAIYKNVKK